MLLESVTWLYILELRNWEKCVYSSFLLHSFSLLLIQSQFLIFSSEILQNNRRHDHVCLSSL